jgi:hypothetical protein
MSDTVFDRIMATVCILLLLGPLIMLPIGAVNSANNSSWRYGYCTALGGEIISDDICAKDGQIIDIPPRP